MVKEKLNYAHISTGDLFRLEAQNLESKLGQEISVLMKEGKMVPLEITMQLLLNAIEKSKSLGFGTTL